MLNREQRLVGSVRLTPLHAGRMGLLHCRHGSVRLCGRKASLGLRAIAQVPPSGTLVRSCWTLQLMRWVRTNRRCGSWLALAAIALQLLLSFGHVHLDGLARSSAVTSVAASEAPSSQQNPAHHPANEAEDFCAICATIHLASSSLLPDAPLLPVPFASRTIEHFGHFAFVFISPQRAAFQSRAPPLA
jgi:hypothetical protein